MTLDTKWEKFAGGPAVTKSISVARVTINRKGLIYLSDKMYTAFGRPKTVALFYNREDGRIAVQRVHDRLELHFKFIKLGTGWGVRAATFCRHYNIRIPNTEQFTRPEIDPDGHLILNLRQTTTVGGITRTKGTGPRTKMPA